MIFSAGGGSPITPVEEMNTSLGVAAEQLAPPPPRSLDDLLAGAAGKDIGIAGIDDDAAHLAAGQAVAAPSDRRARGQRAREDAGDRRCPAPARRASNRFARCSGSRRRTRRAARRRSAAARETLRGEGGDRDDIEFRQNPLSRAVAKSPSPPFRGEREGPAQGGRVRWAAPRPARGPPHPALSPRPAGESNGVRAEKAAHGAIRGEARVCHRAHKSRLWQRSAALSVSRQRRRAPPIG